MNFQNKLFLYEITFIHRKFLNEWFESKKKN